MTSASTILNRLKAYRKKISPKTGIQYSLDVSFDPERSKSADSHKLDSNFLILLLSMALCPISYMFHIVRNRKCGQYFYKINNKNASQSGSVLQNAYPATSFYTRLPTALKSVIDGCGENNLSCSRLILSNQKKTSEIVFWGKKSSQTCYRDVTLKKIRIKSIGENNAKFY